MHYCDSNHIKGRQYVNAGTWQGHGSQITLMVGRFDEF